MPTPLAVGCSSQNFAGISDSEIDREALSSPSCMAQPQSDEDVEDDKPNPRVFLDIEIAEWGEAGRVVIELYADAAPMTLTFDTAVPYSARGEKGNKRLRLFPHESKPGAVPPAHLLSLLLRAPLAPTEGAARVVQRRTFRCRFSMSSVSLQAYYGKGANIVT